MTNDSTFTEFLPTRHVPSDIEIAQAANMKLISEIAEEVGILPEELELHGNYKAKVNLEILDRLKDVKDGIYVDVTAITPPPGGWTSHGACT